MTTRLSRHGLRPSVHLFRLLLLYAWVCGNLVHADTGADDVLTIGLLPSESPVALFSRMAPLREYLSLHLQRNLRFETARDLAEFIHRTAQGKYDIVFTAPHLTLLAQDSGHYEIVSTFSQPLSTVFLVKASSKIQSLADLSGKSIATPPNEAIVTMVGRQLLLSHQIDPEQNVRLLPKSNHSSALHALRSDEVDAAMVANLIYQINQERLPMRVIAQSHSFPGVGILVSNSLPKTLKLRFSDLLKQMRDSAEGLAVLKRITSPGYQSTDSSPFEVLRPYLQQLHEQLHE